MDYWEKNSEILQKHHTILWKHINKFHNQQEKELNYEFGTKQSRDGNLYTIIKKDNQEYRLNSPYKPEEEALRWSEQFQLEKGCVIRMFGFGNGYFVKAIQKKISENDHFLIIEPSIEVLEYAFMNFDLTEILENKQTEIYLWNEMYKEFCNAINSYINWMILNRRIYCEHPKYDKLFEDEYRNYLKKQRTIDLDTLLDRNTEIKMGQRSVDNILNNLKFIKDSRLVNDLIHMIPKDIPIIIVASGPSLDKNVDYLNQAKGHAVIVACDSALRSLIKHQVIPDFVITIDPNKAHFHFKECGFENIPIITNLVSSHQVLSMNKRTKIWYNDGIFEQELYRRCGKMVSILGNCGGCVATTAFAIFTNLGCKRIILVGQDLAYEGDVSHTGGRKSPFKDNIDRFVQGNKGEMLRSRFDWVAYLDWFENKIKRMNGKIEVINATEGGAKIEGTIFMPLQETIEKYCTSDIDIEQILENTNCFLDNKSYQKLFKCLEEIEEELEELANLAEKSAKLCEECYTEFKIKRYVTSSATSKNKKIREMNKKIMESFLYEILQWIFCEECVDLVQELNDSYYSEEENEYLNSYSNSQKVFKSVSKAAKTLKQKIQDQLEKLENIQDNKSEEEIIAEKI